MMGQASDDSDAVVTDQKTDDSVMFVDPKDSVNYLNFMLTKPLGISLVENDDGTGCFVGEIFPEGSASKDSTIKVGDQLVGIDSTKVAGYTFEDAVEKFGKSEAESTKFTFFRGPAKFLYGPTAPDSEWYKDNLELATEDK
jgi:C-terminal processing protease CtpA/Prc